MVHPVSRRNFFFKYILCFALLFSSCQNVRATNEPPPQTEDGIYCSPENCYDVLEVTRDSTLREIKKNYRRLSLQYHPDRNSSPDAVSKFQKISMAHEILSDEDKRVDFDYYLDHPEEVLMNQFRFYRRKYAPETDVRLVVLGFLVFASGFQYYVQASRHREALKYLKLHNKELRKMAKERALQQVKHLSQKRKQNRGQYKAKLEALEAEAIEELAKDIQVQGGYREASFKDVLLVRIIISPYSLLRYLAWVINWYYRFSYLGQEYGREEQIYLTARAVNRPMEFIAQLDTKVLEELLSKRPWEKEASKEH